MTGKKIILECEREVAVESPDHLMPWGTRRDSSRNHRFNEKLYKIYGKEFPSVLDLGCSGGGFVRDCHDDGCLAVGLEGSDFSKKHRRAEWASIPDNLFTCDITRRFQLYIEGERRKRPIKFDVITSWEVMEHIAEENMPALFDNAARHLAKGGMWIMSIANSSDVVSGVELHQTIRSKAWWVGRLTGHGFIHAPEMEGYFCSQYVRGKFDNDTTFHVIVTNDRARLPPIPSQSIFTVASDYWVGSRPQQLLRRFTYGW